MATASIGSSVSFAAELFGTKSQGMLDSLSYYSVPTVPVLSDISRQFQSQADQLYERYNGEDALNAAALAVRNSANLWDQNVIRPLQTIEDFQTAPRVMVRYLMAQPDLRQMYHNYDVHGYGDEYVDTFGPGAVGENHYDYRRVMDGMVEVDDDDWGWTEYYDMLVEGDRNLTFSEQADIRVSWDAIQANLDEDGDNGMTDRYGD